METIVSTIFFIIIVISGTLAIYYSIRSRKETKAPRKYVLMARMNISMGAALISIAVIQIFMFEFSWVRLVVGALFLLLGLFNLFAGIRNHMFYSRQNHS